jgi:aspartyl-tRNA(Asn)/glutamyl-tRNA(Gln) amidotransferase subunit A
VTQASQESREVMQAASRAVAALWRAPLGDPAYDEAEPGDAPEAATPPGGGLTGLPDVARSPGSAGPDNEDLPPVRETGAAAGPAVRDALAAAARTAGLGAFVAVYDHTGHGEGAAGDSGAPRGPVAGMPVAIKDVFDVAGQQVGSGTSGFGHRTASSDSTAWARLAAAGAILIGRTRLPELAWHVRTPGCVNPWAPGRDVGGSSGGSAVAVAAGVVPVALATDTGGSIRIPAALCGVAGLRPTVGAVSGRGVTPLAPAMDTAGPIATTAAECLLVHRLLSGAATRTPGPEEGRPVAVRPWQAGPGASSAAQAGHDPAAQAGHDPAAQAGHDPAAQAGHDPAAQAGHDPAGLRVGWPEGLWRGWVSPDVATSVEAAAEVLRAAGASVEPVELPPLVFQARTAAYVIILAESAGLWHPAMAERRGDVSDRLAALLEAGAALSAADYLRARRVAAAIRREVCALLARQRLAALLLPTVPVAAAPTGADTVEIEGHAVPVEAAYVSLTGLASVTGLPALSVPCGLDHAGLPLGAQLVGPAHAEAALCLLGGVIENGPGGRAVAAARQRMISSLLGGQP